MRVIAGSARGKTLNAPRGTKTRPTSDRVREALFSILTSRRPLAGMRVLDICAGTGALGIEALSRGASTCCFVERDRSALAALQSNLTATGFGSQCEVRQQEALQALRALAAHGRQFDLVFFDPPYDSGLYESLPPLLDSLPLLSGEATLVIERAQRSTERPTAGGLIRSDSRTYGDTTLDFYQREET